MKDLLSIHWILSKKKKRNGNIIISQDINAAGSSVHVRPEFLRMGKPRQYCVLGYKTESA